MKTSLITSAVLHGLVLTWALVSLGSPEDFEVSSVEAMPVDIVPIEEFTQIQQGDKAAPKAEKSSPVPTEADRSCRERRECRRQRRRPEDAAETEIEAGRERSPPAPSRLRKSLFRRRNRSRKTHRKSTEEKPASEPATEVASLPEPKQEVKSDPKPEEQPAEEQPAENPEAEALPDKIPTPVMKPKVEQQAQTAKTPDRKNEENKKEKKKSSTSKESDFNADEVAALLNKQDSSGGGAKRAKDPTAFGGKKTTVGNTLSQSEMDALRGQIQNNWSIIPGMADAADVRVKVTMQLDRDGNLIGTPEVEATGGSEAARQALASGASRAIRSSVPFKGPSRRQIRLLERGGRQFRPELNAL